jgi:6-phosphogluconolactonase (cycloisomerase 2 family)
MRVLTRACAARAASAVLAGAALSAGAALAASAVATPASAATAGHGLIPPSASAVFVQTDNTAGNEIVAYHRAADGTLTQTGTYPTGGLGGQLTGSVVDHLASQGSLAYDPSQARLYAVNAGSNTVSVFGVYGDRLRLLQVISSGGTFPVSVAVHGDLVYVLNATGGGSVQGYWAWFGRLFPIPGSARQLGLNPGATPQFTNTPGQVAFSPDGSQLIVTTKANGSDIDVFGVGWSGSLSPSPAVNPEPGAVPFAVSFDPAGHLDVAEAGPNALASFTLAGHGTLSPVDSAGTGQQATCWVANDGGLAFVSNAGSATVSTFVTSPGGRLTLVGQTATDPGTVDAAVAPGGRFLYVQTGGNGIVDEFAVGSGGSLTAIGSVTVPGAVGGEGIAAA